MTERAGFAPGPWEYNDPTKFTQGHGQFSETAVYAAGNAFPWRMAEIQGPNEATEIATAHLIAAAPDMYEALEEILALDDHYDEGSGGYHEGPYAKIARAALAKARGEGESGQ